MPTVEGKLCILSTHFIMGLLPMGGATDTLAQTPVTKLMIVVWKMTAFRAKQPFILYVSDWSFSPVQTFALALIFPHRMSQCL